MSEMILKTVLFTGYLAFQRRDLQMYKQYAKTVRIPLTENEQGLLKRTRLTSSFVSAHAP